jgi:hypothetical protein
VIVYTAIYGDYDDLKPVPKVDWFEFVCMTDNPDRLDPDAGWSIVKERARFEHPRMSAKWWKCSPPGGQSSLWVDGSVQLTGLGLLVDALQVLAEGAPIAMYTHPFRDCIFDEVGEAQHMIKYDGLPMSEQVEWWAARGWPRNGGLWASTIIARNGSYQNAAFGHAWFQHCLLHTYQDQLSLPGLLDMYDLECVPLPGSLIDNPGFKWTGEHRSDL